MKIARVTGTVTATVKDSQLVGHKLLIVDVENGYGDVEERSVVAVDAVGAGVGEYVLIVLGSAARIPRNISGIAVDASIIGIIDQISIKTPAH